MVSLTTDELKKLATMVMAIDSGRRTNWSGTKPIPHLMTTYRPQWSPYLPFSFTRGLDEQLPEFTGAIRRAAEQVQRDEGRKVIEELDKQITDEAKALEEAKREKAGAKKPAAKRKINEAIRGTESRLENLKKHKQDSAYVLEQLQKR